MRDYKLKCFLYVESVNTVCLKNTLRRMLQFIVFNLLKSLTSNIKIDPSSDIKIDPSIYFYYSLSDCH